jgi:hypothetical protein
VRRITREDLHDGSDRLRDFATSLRTVLRPQVMMVMMMCTA